MVPHSPPARRGSPRTKPSPILEVKTNPLTLSGSHDYHRHNGIGDQIFPGQPVPPTKEELAKKAASKECAENKKSDKIQLKQVSIKKV